MSKPKKYLTRREFLKAGTCGAMTIGPLVNTIAQLSLVNSAAASVLGGGSIGTDYKALVCIFLRGGCDTNNILIPVGVNPLAEVYAADRGAVAVPNGVVNASYNPDGNDDTIPIAVPGLEPMGLHPNLPNLAEMYGGGEAAFITNVGTLAEPTTQSSYSTSSLPKQLFSHSDQVTQWMSSISDKPYESGWGARVADLYHDTWNELNPTSMLITAAGTNQFMNGGYNSQYSVTSTGAISLAGFGTNYASALDGSGNYLGTSQGNRLKALEKIMQYSHAHIIEEGYSQVIQSARENESVISEAIAVEASLGINFDAIWAEKGANSDLATELKAVARLIAGRECLGNKRQIFFVDLGGFDTHSNLNGRLNSLLTQLDQAVGAFNAGMKELATPNGTATSSAGTDHAWGTHTFAFGGAVNGGDFYGSFPTLGVGTADDVPSGSRGRWIPTTAVDQLGAKVANWFGVPAASSEMAAIFPNLYRFEDPFDLSGSANLGFI